MKIKRFGQVLSPEVPVTVGIDQSYSGFGFAVLGKDDSYLVEVVQFDGHGVDRLAQVDQYLYEKFTDLRQTRNNVVDVAMEGYSYGSQVAHKAGELGATVKLNLRKNENMYPLIVPPTTLKKYVTGKGNASKKSQMMLATYKKWGVELLDDNAADAYGLARLAFGYQTTAYEKEVIDTMSDPKHRESTNVEL